MRRFWLACLMTATVYAAAGVRPQQLRCEYRANPQGIDVVDPRLSWVLPACRANGTSCGTGDECCCGFCRASDGGGTVCVCKPPGCSNEYETCTTAADCCNKNDKCINGRCAVPAPQ